MQVAFRTFGCKANQYDGERMRQEVEARGAGTSGVGEEADVCVVNTCTVTNQADAEARRFIRRLHRENPRLRVVVAGCSAALRAPEYREMPGVTAVVAGHDPVAVAEAVGSAWTPPDPTAAPLVQLGTRRSLDTMDQEPVGGEILLRREGATRGWLKIQDGCDRKCSFCATRLARGENRSRLPDEVIREARALSATHPELVLTGIHIGHYGLDLEEPSSLSRLLALLLDRVPHVRFRLGSIEATEVDDLLLELLTGSDGRVAPHLHMPLQSGADPVLRRMRRWHTREMYRRRTLEIAERMSASGPVMDDGFPVLGLGADIITGFPGETEEDHRHTVRLIEELPFTYLHVFPFSPREGTVAAELQREMPVPQRVAGERSKELREIVQAKEAAYRQGRAGTQARIVIEGEGRSALTEDYLRVSVKGPLPEDHCGLHDVELAEVDGELLAVFTTG
jgi:threonylcarbamoyladenosine tRNA methylthiotransferase MtaB